MRTNIVRVYVYNVCDTKSLQEELCVHYFDQSWQGATGADTCRVSQVTHKLW